MCLIRLDSAKASLRARPSAGMTKIVDLRILRVHQHYGLFVFADTAGTVLMLAEHRKLKVSALRV
jgi:hypothetical protein